MNTLEKTRSTLYIVLLLLLELSLSSVHAQYQLVGNAVKTDTSIYRLTENVMWQNGSIWNIKKINLNNSFDLLFELYLGNNNAGADGIAFTLQPLSTNAGAPGQGLGSGGIIPSVIVEFDTYPNGYDPVHDHIAISKNGDLDHKSANNLAGPVYATADSMNIEDGQWHNARVRWNASTKKMEVYFDCVLRLTYTGDIVSTIFGNNPNVYYGFTAATGGASNEQSLRDFHFIQTTKVDTAICKGDTIQVDFSGDKSYSWTPATNISSTTSSKPFLYPAASTQYIVTVTGECNDIWRDTVTITVNNNPTVDLGSDKTMCSNDAALIFDAGNPGSTYLWSSAETSRTISKSVSGTYIVTVTDNNTCNAKDTVILITNPSPAAPSIANHTICAGAPPVTFDAGGGYFSYAWSDKGTGTAQTTPGITAGTYTVTVTNIAGCTNSASGKLTINDLPIVSIADKTICEGSNVVFDAGAGFKTYAWTGKKTGSAQTLSASQAGTYNITVTNAFDCSASDNATLTVNETPTVNLGPDTIMCFYNNIFSYSVSNNYTSVLWSTGATGNSTTLSHADSLKITVSNQFCTATDVKYVGEKCDEIKLCFPNVFTPNSDGFNDDFRPCGINGEKIDNGNSKFYNDNILFMHFMVYDRWGIIMYENNNPEIPIWDGYYAQNPASSGTYFWVVKYANSSSSKYEQSGYVTLIKD